jgi:hypothetical protein
MESTDHLAADFAVVYFYHGNVASYFDLSSKKTPTGCQYLILLILRIIRYN